MKRNRWLCLTLLALASGTAWSGELNALREVRVQAKGAGAEILVSGSRPPQFTVFRLSEPDRLVVDLSAADASAIEGQKEGLGPVSGVVVSQFKGEHSAVGRLLIALKHSSAYDVRPDGHRLVISIDGQGGAPTALPAEPRAESPTIVGLKLSSAGLEVASDGEIGKYEVLGLEHPPRLVLDVYGAHLKVKLPHGEGRVRAIRAAPHGDKVRLVLDLKGTVPPYEVLRRPHGLTLALKEDAPASEPSEAEIDGKKIRLSELSPVPVVTPPPAVRPPNARVEVLNVDFKEKPAGGALELKLSSQTRWKVDHPDEHSAVLTLENAHLPKRLERSLDTSALETPVKMVSAFAVPGQDSVRVVVTASGPWQEAVRPVDFGLRWQFSTQGAAPEQAVSSAKVAPDVAETEGPDSEPAPARPSPAPQKSVSFEFKDIDIHNLLRVIAEVSKKNVVVADDVSGKVTIRLRNVPWQQALELILRSKGLGKEELGSNIIRVAPLKVLEEEAQIRAERKKAMVAQEELAVQLIPVNYAAAKDMVDRVRDVLSPRGNVAVDTRTNVLIVRDVQSNIGRARALVHNLDLQTPQVLIESRIVEANTTFSRQIGVQWGGLSQAAPGTGNPTGLIFPNTVSVQGASTSDANTGVSSDPHFAVNLPAAVGTGSGGALGFVFGSIGGALALNLRLSALETEGSVKTISAPKVTTLDNITAKISQGVSIPYSQVSAQGVNTVFVEARLQLEVTPHITQDGSILMAIHAENAQPDPSSTGANGQPAIQRKEAVTQVMVKDGDTTVIGGIYVRRGSTSTSGIPFFSKIPVLGWLFQNNTNADTRQELLIFITPRIINRQVIAQTL